jgi:hypothetical protein
MPVRSIVSRCGLAALLSLVACGWDPTSSSGETGRISFSYSGVESGRFVAIGGAENGGDREYAVSSLFQRSVHLPVTLVINGSVRLGNGSDAELTILVPPMVARTVCPAGFYPCEASATLVLKARSAVPGDERVYRNRSIEVNVSEVTEQRVRGTFEMTAEQLSPSGAYNGRAVEVRSGEFDVPVVDLPPEFAGPSLTSFRVSGKARGAHSTSSAVH